MGWLNYHHLQYFWTVAEEGSIAAASRKLMVGRPAISMQLKSLESFLGAELFSRRGRGLELTETGRLVHAYADDIFTTGRELVDAVRGRPAGRPMKLRVGIADAMPKLVAFQLLQPALDFEDPLSLDCREGHPDRLFAALALHELDLVLSDLPLHPGVDVRAFNHRVGESTVTLFAGSPLYRRLARGGIDALDGAPFLLPAPSSGLRRRLDRWFEEQDLKPEVVAEFEDSALLKVFGRAGRGVFPAPTVVAEEIAASYRAKPLHELEGVVERYYVVSPERRIKHPAVARIVETARLSLFGTG